MTDHNGDTPDPDIGGYLSEALGQNIDDLESAPDAPALATATVPLIQLDTRGAEVATGRNDETGDRVLVIGPVAVQIILPLSAETARAVAKELGGGIEIATSVPQARGRLRRRSPDGG